MDAHRQRLIRRQVMIRIVLVASTVILFLTFAVPVMLYLERKMKRDP